MSSCVDYLYFADLTVNSEFFPFFQSEDSHRDEKLVSFDK